MAAANPQPLQARPFEEHARGTIQIEDDDGDYEDDAMDDVEEANVNSVNVAEHRIVVGGVNGGGGAAGGGVVMASRTSELTLSFEGEVYVFPAVTPEKVFVFFQMKNLSLLLLFILLFDFGDKICFPAILFVFAY